MTATPQPLILFIAGYAGSGKTMIGKMIASKLHAPYLDKDTLFRPIIEQSLRLTTGDPYAYTGELYELNFKRLEYETMLDIAIENAKLNSHVVLTGPFTHSRGSASFQDPEWIKLIDRRCQKINARWHLLWVYSSNDKIKQMIAGRKAPRDSWKLSHWDEYVRTYHMNEAPIHFGIPNYSVIKNDGRHLRDIEKNVDDFLETLQL